jgi:hypothetical protein
VASELPGRFVVAFFVLCVNSLKQKVVTCFYQLTL